MSHPDPDNSLEDDNMSNNFADYNYDYHDAFYGEDGSSYHPDADHEVESQFDDSYDDSMDGDHDSAMESCGWGTDKYYGYYGDDTPICDDYYGGE